MFNRSIDTPDVCMFNTINMFMFYLEVSVVDPVKSDQTHKKPDVRLCELRTSQVPALRQNLLSLKYNTIRML